MPFTLPDLPYDYDALEPHIDAKTMEIHHDRHHKAYVDNANAALAGTEWEDRTAEQVLIQIDLMPEEKRAAVRNNAGGHANHTLFWEIMGPDGGGEPTGDLKAAIDETFESVDALRTAMNDAGVKRFGSGWSWLVYDGTGLAVYSTPNQDSPSLKDFDDVPLIGIDVWEHSYYLKYQNKRPDYLAAWWNVIDWDAVAKRFEARDKLKRK
jgi:superoxide dismutase, Fe-Mn family